MVSVEITRCRIPEHLVRLRQTQTWLADETGISKQRISAYVNLRVIMSFPVAFVVARKLKCHIEELYECRVRG
jgi:DNA-binding XRE family transcriptional regulator